MATLEQNIKQAISDFDGIKEAIEESGVEVPYGTDTKDYPEKIAKIKDKAFESGYAEGQASVEREIDPTWTDWRNFSYYNNRNSLVSKLKYSDTSNGKDFSSMFSNCRNLTTVPLFDTSNGTNFSGMFNGCSSLTEIPLFNTSEGTNFGSMFGGCSSLTEIPLFNTSKGTSFSSMFASCSSLTEIPLFDTSKGTNFSSMFASCSSLTEIPLFDTSKGIYFGSMFSGCTSLVSVPKLNLSLSSGNFSNVFTSCSALENLTIEGEIKKTGLSVQNSNNLTHESLMSIINALYDYSGTTGTYTVTLGATNKAKLTAEELLIASNKGWTVS